MSSPEDGHRRYSNESDVFSNAEVYYARGAAASRKDPKNRTWSARYENHRGVGRLRPRRWSSDEHSSISRKFYLQVDETLNALLTREDTDKNCQITIDDKGPKVGISCSVNP